MIRHRRSTYESTRILETLLREQNGNQKPLKNTLELIGSLCMEAAKFPLDTTFLPGQPLVISKEGKLPLYLTACRK